MTLRRQVWFGGLVALLIGAVFLVAHGRTGRGSLWLDGTPDPAARQVSLFVFGSCSDDEEIRSIFVNQDVDVVVVDVRIRWPLGIGAPACGSYQGIPLTVSLDEPLGNRTVSVLNSDGSSSPIQPSPFTVEG